MATKASDNPEGMMVRPGRPAGSLTRRLLIIAGIWICAALVGFGVVLSMAFRNYVEADFDERLATSVNSMVGAAELDAQGTVYFARPLGDQRFLEPYSGWYWQVAEEGRTPFRSRSLWDSALPVDFSHRDVALHFETAEGPDGQLLRIAVRDAVLPDTDRSLRFMTAADTAQIEDDIAEFNQLIIWSLTGLGLGLLGAVALQITFGLKPLRRVKQGLADVRTGRSKRLTGTFPSEVQPLVDETNLLIDHSERVVERARTHAGNLAHALKTPLSVIDNAARTGDNALAETVLRQSGAMREQIDHHLKRARAAGGGVVGAITPIEKPVENLLRVMPRIHAEKTLSLDADVETGLAFAGERQDLDEMLGNLVDNACKWARSKVYVRARRITGEGIRPMLEVTVEDDGPGVDDAVREELFKRGKRLDETVPGSGLGLAIVQDIAELSGGSVSLNRAALGGLKARLVLPAVPV